MGIAKGIIMKSNMNWLMRKYCMHSTPVRSLHSAMKLEGISSRSFVISEDEPTKYRIPSGSKAAISGKNATVPSTKRFLNTSAQAFRTI